MIDNTLTPAFVDLATQQQREPATPQPSTEPSVFDINQFHNATQNTETQPSRVIHSSIIQNTGIQSTAMPHQTPRIDNQPSGWDAAITLLKNLNGASDLIGIEALKAASPHQELTPGEMLQITVKTHEFLFQSEMTANVANRTSDGIQQLFKQQS
jgi:hypothetical protein